MSEFTITQNGRVKPVILRNKGNGRILGTAARPEALIKSQFFARIRKGDLDQCWEWEAGRQSRIKGRDYGIVWMHGIKWKAHRLAWMYEFGPIPEGLNVLHKCDNPPCCNPNHLFLGTHLDNVTDCLNKGRGNRELGEDRYNAKLTEKDIKEIRRRYQPRHPKNSGHALAREFGIAPTMAHAIITRKRWRHVG